MKNVLRMGSLVLTTIALVAGPANAAGLCKLTGSYSDDFGSTTAIKGLKGNILNTFVCATPYTFKVSQETKLGFTVTGKNATKSCGTFSAGLTFMGSCSVFGGSVTIHGSVLSDTFTKITPPKSNASAVSSDLLSGLHN